MLCFKHPSTRIMLCLRNFKLLPEKEKVYYRGSREVPLILKPKKPIDMIGTFGKEEKLE